MKRKRTRYLHGIMLGIGAAALASTVLGFIIHSNTSGKAAEIRTGTVRILATGDLHGQVTSVNYETDQKDPTVGFSKIATMIMEQRAEAGKQNTVLVDAGDTLYNYSTNFFYDYNTSIIQPIYQAMEMMEYDAVTLGNHELDYPWDYVIDQLNDANLLHITTVSNLVYDDTGETPLATSIVTTKQITLSDGSTAEVSIGIIGATRQELSSKRQRYSGFLSGQDIYTSVKNEAELLKASGVDIVVAVIHGGIGILSGSNTTASPGARLAALEEIDAVVTSHTHEAFPLNNGTYKGYTNVNEESGLINGTPVVANGSYAAFLGQIDLTVSIDDIGNVTVESGSAELFPVEEDTVQLGIITSMFNKYQKVLSRKLDKTEYELAEGTVLTNADCVVSDTALYQLINNAKISFGTSYIYEYLPEYKDYPVIAVTSNKLDSKEEYIYVEDSVNSTDIAALISQTSSERDSGYIYLYKITGKNLREWLEYNASIYAMQGTKFTTILPSFTKKNTSVSTLLNESRLLDWSSFFVFDGISYEIDLSVGARYKNNGTIASYYNTRIKNLTCQGKTVTDSQVFILVSDTFGVNYSFMPASSDSVYGIFPWIDGKDVVMDYIEQQAELGPVSAEPDHNWCFYKAEGYEFAFGTMAEAFSYGNLQNWYYKNVSGLRLGLKFFWGKYITPVKNMNILLSKGITKETGQYVPVKVTAVSLAAGAEVSSIIYRRGIIDSVDAAEWQYGTVVRNNEFNVSDNGDYSVLVTDSLGNSCISRIVVDNINPLIIDIPNVNMMTNRRRAVTGIAVPGSTVHVKASDGEEYTVQAGTDGSFTVAIPPQPAGKSIAVWVSEGTRSSRIVTVEIYRTGPNTPEVIQALSGTESITCMLDENEIPVVVMNRTVYLMTGTTDRYKSSSIYNAAYKIVETDTLLNPDGLCLVMVPAMKSGTTFYLYALDWQNRESLRTVYTVE